jgi:ribosomal protein L40E
MVKFPEADVRMFRNKFVCRRCKSVISSPSRKVSEGEVKCRKCQGKAFKPKRKK